jgi:glycosyltransferase involved in cell wall biosynthesis
LKLLIYCTINTPSDYAPFVRELTKSEMEAKCISSHLFPFQSAPLSAIPVPSLLALVRQFNPDIVFVDLPLYAPQMAKLTNRKVIYHVPGDVWSEFNQYRVMSRSIFRRMYNNYLNLVLDKGIQNCDLILANSKWLLNIVKQKIPQHHSDLLYTGIDSEKWVPCPKDPLYLKFPAVVGTFDFGIYQKVLGFLKFIRVIRKMPDVNFYFAGNGPFFNLVKQSCPPNLFLMGRVSKPQVRKLLGSADIFVHPSGLDVLPRSVKEASLMEKPIVASNIGGIPEIVKNNQTGYLCEVEDVNQWIEKIRFLLDNPDVARILGKNARNFVIDTFNWKKITEGFIETLKLSCL